jgi:hypothetical protein
MGAPSRPSRPWADRAASRAIPPSRIHRHRDHGLLAPYAPRRPQVAALSRQAPTPPPELAAAPPARARSPARDVWAALLAPASTRSCRCAAPGAGARCVALLSSLMGRRSIPSSATWASEGSTSA